MGIRAGAAFDEEAYDRFHRIATIVGLELLPSDVRNS